MGMADDWRTATAQTQGIPATEGQAADVVEVVLVSSVDSDEPGTHR